MGELHAVDGKITASVAGTHSYQVTLRHTSRQFEGSCDCPASDNFDFCKHCVATALKYRVELAEREQLSKGSKGDKVLAYLKSLNKQELAQALYGLLAEDNTLFEEWSLKAEIASGGLDAKAMKKRITAAIPYNRHLHRYAQVRDYFSRVETLAQFLLENLHLFEAEQALTLTEYALQRVQKALESIDDSGGFRYTSVADLQACHVQACAALDWSKNKLADYLTQIFIDKDESFHPPIPAAYREVLEAEGLAAFYAVINKAWEALPALQASEEWHAKYRYLKLGSVLEEQAEEENNLPRIIELKAKTAISTYEFIALSKLCQAVDMQQAEHWLARAEQANQNSIHRMRDYEVDYQQIRIWQQQGKFKQALKLQWQLYCQQPSLQRYKKLKALAAAASNTQGWLQEALAYNVEQYAGDRPIRQKQQHADAIVELNLFEGQEEAALQFAEQHAIDPHLLLQTAAANAQHVERVLPLYARVARHEVSFGNNKSYHSAITVLKQARNNIGAEHYHLLDLHIDELRREFKAKRNFMKWLAEAFPVA